MILADISKASDAEFEKLVNLTTYAHKFRYGVIFVWPAHREASGQKPYDIDNHTICLDDDGNVNWKRLKQIAESSHRPVAFIKRNGSGELDDVLYLPGPLSEKEPSVKNVTFEFEVLKEEYRRYKGGL
jgi:hypothetical protein